MKNHKGDFRWDLYNKGVEETFFKHDAKSRKPMGYSEMSGGGWWMGWMEE